MNEEINEPAEHKVWIDLRTGKPHISWSETSTWIDCSHKHKLRMIDKIDLSEPSSTLDFGTACHAACDDYARSRVMKPEVAHEILRRAFTANAGKKSYEPELLELMLKQSTEILADVPAFLDETFPGWELVAAEQALYEPISASKSMHAFKGFIDLVIRAPNPKKAGRFLIHILDYKTSSSGFWSPQKQSDPKVTGQLVSYKHYWMQQQRYNGHVNDVRCGFILLKRNANPGRHCELIPVSAGDKTLAKTLKVVNNCIASIQRGGVAFKNRDSCRYCEFKNTEHCP